MPGDAPASDSSATGGRWHTAAPPADGGGTASAAYGGATTPADSGGAAAYDGATMPRGWRMLFPWSPVMAAAHRTYRERFLNYFVYLKMVLIGDMYRSVSNTYPYSRTYLIQICEGCAVSV